MCVYMYVCANEFVRIVGVCRLIGVGMRAYIGVHVCMCVCARVSTCTIRLQHFVSISMNSIFGCIFSRHAQLSHAQAHHWTHLHRSSRSMYTTKRVHITYVRVVVILHCHNFLFTLRFWWHTIASACGQDVCLYGSVLQSVAVSCSMPKTSGCVVIFFEGILKCQCAT